MFVVEKDEGNIESVIKAGTGTAMWCLFVSDHIRG